MAFRHTYHRVQSMLTIKIMVMKTVMFTLDLHTTAKQFWIKRFRKTTPFPTLTQLSLN